MAMARPLATTFAWSGPRSDHAAIRPKLLPIRLRMAPSVQRSIHVLLLKLYVRLYKDLRPSLSSRNQQAPIKRKSRAG